MATTKKAADDTKDLVPEPKADLRKFNQAEEQVTKALAALSSIAKIDTPEQLATMMENLQKAKKVETVIENKRTEMVGPFNAVVKKINQFAKDLAGKLPPAINAAKQLVINYNNEQLRLQKEKRKLERGAQLVAIGMELQTNGNGEADHYTCPPSIRGVFPVFIYQLADMDDVQWPSYLQTITNTINQARADQLNSLQQEQDLIEAFGSDDDKVELSEKIKGLQQPALPVNGSPVSYGGGGGFTSVKGMTKTWTFTVVDPALVPAEYLVVDEAKIKKAVAEGVRTIAGVTIFQKDGLAIR